MALTTSVKLLTFFTFILFYRSTAHFNIVLQSVTLHYAVLLAAVRSVNHILSSLLCVIAARFFPVRSGLGQFSPKKCSGRRMRVAQRLISTFSSGWSACGSCWTGRHATQESFAFGNNLNVLDRDSAERENALVYLVRNNLWEAATANIRKQRTVATSKGREISNIRADEGSEMLVLRAGSMKRFHEGFFFYV
jgi:hypothetical protein